MPSQDRAAIFLLSGSLALLSVACSQVNNMGRSNKAPEPVVAESSTSSNANPTVTPKPSVTAKSQPRIAAKDAYERALDAAYSAASLSQSAQSSDDWQLVISRWQEAIKLLRVVPSSSTYYAIAKSKLAQYQSNLRIAQQEATRPRSSSPSRTITIAPRTAVPPVTPAPTRKTTASAPATQSKTNTANSQVFKAPIKRRASGTPIIDVTFNGQQTYEMIVDTGASGTVITPAMAQSLNVVPEGEVTANTASNKGIKFSTGKVQSIAVEGIVAKNVVVAIAGPDLELGLLGQDFFGNYDVWIKQDVVEFHPR
ncbi:MAG TPA: retropepsin-like aspartic protease [Coleofasciculaceae cyanobacterium]|jgi:predicted aspartyl protease